MAWLKSFFQFCWVHFCLVFSHWWWLYFLFGDFAFELLVNVLRCSIKSTSAAQTFVCAEDDKASTAGIKKQDREDPSQNVERF